MNRLEKLQDLEKELLSLMKKANSRTFAALARQYRDTIREIEEIEGGESDGDEIGDLLESREADGKSGAVRPNRT